MTDGCNSLSNSCKLFCQPLFCRIIPSPRTQLSLCGSSWRSLLAGLRSIRRRVRRTPGIFPSRRSHYDLCGIFRPCSAHTGHRLSGCRCNSSSSRRRHLPHDALLHPWCTGGSFKCLHQHHRHRWCYGNGHRHRILVCSYAVPSANYKISRRKLSCNFSKMNFCAFPSTNLAQN